MVGASLSESSTSFLQEIIKVTQILFREGFNRGVAQGLTEMCLRGVQKSDANGSDLNGELNVVLLSRAVRLRHFPPSATKLIADEESCGSCRRGAERGHVTVEG